MPPAPSISSATHTLEHDDPSSPSYSYALTHLLDLDCSDFPSGRSFSLKRSNDSSGSFPSTLQHVILDVVAARLADLQCLDAAVVLLDPKRLIFDVPSQRMKRADASKGGEMEDGYTEGFGELWDELVGRFFELALPVLKSMAAGPKDCAAALNMAKLLFMVRTTSTYASDPRRVNTAEVVQLACEGLEGLPDVFFFTNKDNLKSVVEELMKSDDSQVDAGGIADKQPIVTWKRIALRLFHSDKLKLRRAGLEQLGEICRVLKSTFAIPSHDVAVWLRGEGILESTFINRPDERVIPCIEELLVHVEWDVHMVEVFLAQAGLPAVQRVLANVSHHESFSDAITFRMLDTAARNVAGRTLNMEASASLIMSVLVMSKSTRHHLVKKGTRSALAAMRALICILIFGRFVSSSLNSLEDETQILDALFSVAVENEGKTHRRYIIDLLISTLLPSALNLPLSVQTRVSDVEALHGAAFVPVGSTSSSNNTLLDPIALDPPPALESFAFPSLVRPEANREASHRALRKLFLAFPASSSSIGFEHSLYFSECVLRADILIKIQDEWNFRQIWFADLQRNTRAGENALQPRLDVLAFFLRFHNNTFPTLSTNEYNGIGEASVDLTIEEMSSIWATAKKINEQETLAFWIATCSLVGCSPCLSKKCMRFVLESLWTKEELIHGGACTYFCLQTLFCQVNEPTLSTTQEHETGSRAYRRSCPPSDKGGNKLVGRRVSVLYQDGSMQHGIVSGYKEVWGKHVIDYDTGIVEEKQLDELKEWWLLPEPANTEAGPVVVHAVRERVESLLGLESIWVLALESESDAVAERASDLLVGLHKNSGSNSFIGRVNARLEEARLALSAPNVTHDADFNRDTIRCIELLKMLEIYSSTLRAKRGFSKRHQDCLTGSTFTVVVDSTRPASSSTGGGNVEIGPSVALESKTMENQPSMVPISYEIQASSNMRLDEFVRAVSMVSNTPERLCQVSIDPQSEIFCGGLGIPFSSYDLGADRCVLEEVGAHLNSRPVRASLGTRAVNGGDFQTSDSLSIVPYESNSGLTTPLSEPTPPRDVSMAMDTVMDEFIDESSLTRSSSALGQLDWVYPKRHYPVLFSFLQPSCRASPRAKRSVWEFLQLLPTMNDLSGCPFSPLASLYLVQMLETSPDSLVSLKTEREFADVLTQVYTTLFSSTNGISVDDAFLAVVAASMSGALRLASKRCGANHSLDVYLAVCRWTCDSLMLIKRSLKKEFDELSSSGVHHECANVMKARRMPPDARLCDDCVRSRKLLKSSLILLEELDSVFKMGGLPLWGLFLQNPFSCEFLWGMLLDHPVNKVREDVRKVFENAPSADALLNSLITCERKLEGFLQKSANLSVVTFSSFGGGDVFESFFQLFGKCLVFSNPETTNETFQRVVKMVLDWKQGDVQESTPSGRLFVGFVRLLARVAPHSRLFNAVRSRMIRELFSKFFMNSSKATLLFQDARSAVASLIRVLVNASLVLDGEDESSTTTRPPRTSADDENLMVIVNEMDDFLLHTPVPLRRQEKGWGFEIDWSVDPNSNDGGGLRLRNDTAKVGLLNRGSTCYLNSVLQLLYSVEPFREAVLNADIRPPPPKPAMSLCSSTNLSILTAPPLPPPLPPRQSVIVGWRCWCSGVNDLESNSCHICATDRPSDPDPVSESFSFVPPNELGVMSLQDEEMPPVVKVDEKEPFQVEILCEVQRTFAYLRDGRQSCFDPYKLIMACKPLKLQYAVTSQNDASELYDKIMDALEVGLRKEGNMACADLLRECFSGKQVKLKHCDVCGTLSESNPESFFRLDVMINSDRLSKSDLVECLQAYTAPEEMSGDNRVECDTCRMRTNTTFTVCLTHVPDFLFVHPKRFSYDLELNQIVKLNQHVSFPKSVDLYSYTKEAVTSRQSHTAAAGVAGGTEEGLESAMTLEVPEGNSNFLYDLRGILVHRGKAGGGHYYSYVEAEPGKWVLLNDERVTTFDPERIPDECFGGRVERSSADVWGYARSEVVDIEKNALMILYVRRKTESRPTVAFNSPSGQHRASPMQQDLNLSDKDLFDLGWNEDQVEVDEDSSLDEADLVVISKGKATTAMSVPKPLPAFLGENRSLTSVGKAALAQARSLQESALIRNVHVDALNDSADDADSKLQYDLMQYRSSLEMEVERASQAVSRQAVLFNSVTQKLAYDLLCDSIETSAVDHLVGPAFRFFFFVIARSKGSTLDIVRDWLNLLQRLIARCDPDAASLFARTTLKEWAAVLDASSIASSSDIGMPMSRPASVGESILDCPDFKTRKALVDGIALLVFAITPRDSDGVYIFFESLLLSNSMRLASDSSLRLVEATILAWRTFVACSLIASETAKMLAVWTLIAKAISQARTFSLSPNLVSEGCSLIVTLWNSYSDSILNHDPDRTLNDSSLRDIVLNVGLNADDASAVIDVLACQIEACSTVVELEGFVSKIIGIMAIDCRVGAVVPSFDMPFQNKFMTDVMGSSKDGNRMKLVLATIRLNTVVGGSEMILERCLQRAFEAVNTSKVMDAINCREDKLSKETWEERLFSLDSANLQLACRLLWCVAYGSEELMAVDGCIMDLLQSFETWRVVSFWFLLITSPYNQAAEDYGMDALPVANLRAVMRRLAGESSKRVDELVGSNAKEICFRVEGANERLVNGVYHYTSEEMHGFPRWMNDQQISLYRCPLINGNDEWFLSHFPEDPSTENLIVEFYSSPALARDSEIMVPAFSNWKPRTRGRHPSPTVLKMLERDLVDEAPTIKVSNMQGEEDEVLFDLPALTRQVHYDLPASLVHGNGVTEDNC